MIQYDIYLLHVSKYIHPTVELIPALLTVQPVDEVGCVVNICLFISTMIVITAIANIPPK